VLEPDALDERLGAVRAGLAEIEEHIVCGAEVQHHRELLRRLKSAALCINVAAQLAQLQELAAAAEAKETTSGSSGPCPRADSLAARIASTRARPPMSPNELHMQGARKQIGAGKCATPRKCGASNRYPLLLG